MALNTRDDDYMLVDSRNILDNDGFAIPAHPSGSTSPLMRTSPHFGGSPSRSSPTLRSSSPTFRSSSPTFRSTTTFPTTAGSSGSPSGSPSFPGITLQLRSSPTFSSSLSSCGSSTSSSSSAFLLPAPTRSVRAQIRDSESLTANQQVGHENSNTLRPDSYLSNHDNDRRSPEDYPGFKKPSGLLSRSANKRTREALVASSPSPRGPSGVSRSLAQSAPNAHRSKRRRRHSRSSSSPDLAASIASLVSLPINIPAQTSPLHRPTTPSNSPSRQQLDIATILNSLHITGIGNQFSNSQHSLQHSRSNCSDDVDKFEHSAEEFDIDDSDLVFDVDSVDADEDDFSDKSSDHIRKNERGLQENRSQGFLIGLGSSKDGGFMDIDVFGGASPGNGFLYAMPGLPQTRHPTALTALDKCVSCACHPNMIFVDCGHFCSCENCYTKFEKCPVCFKAITSRPIKSFTF